MSEWRLAESLVVLREQVNRAWPSRSKVSDGTIGDDAHAATASDHNPNAQGVVCAFDVTHDPANGCNAGALFDAFVADPPPAAKYVIFGGRISSRSHGWGVRLYGGADPHLSHLHVSVGVGPDGQSTGPYDDVTAWPVEASTPTPLPPTEGVKMYLGRFASDGLVFLHTGHDWFHVADPADVEALRSAGVPYAGDLSEHWRQTMLAEFGPPKG